MSCGIEHIDRELYEALWAWRQAKANEAAVHIRCLTDEDEPIHAEAAAAVEAAEATVRSADLSLFSLAVKHLPRGDPPAKKGGGK